MRRGFGILGVVVTVLVIAVVGYIAYQYGYSDGFSQHVPAGTQAGPPYPYYHSGFWGPHAFGFGWIFGLLFFLFLGFVFFRIVAFGIFGGRRRGWGYGHGWGMSGGGVPPAIDERMKEWHRQAHGEAPAPSTPPPPPPPPPAPDK